MPRGTFFANKGPLSVGELAELLGGTLGDGVDPEFQVSNVASLSSAASDEISYFHDRRYLKDLSETKAGVVLTSNSYSDKVPASAIALIVPSPELAFAQTTGAFFPDAVRPVTGFGGTTFDGQVHETATLEDGVIIAPGALVGPHAHIGSGTEIGPNAVIGAHVEIGRDCLIGANVSLVCALLGDRVFIQAGASIGQDGFGYSLSPTGLYKIPQIGRVIIQNDVEIGANATIDRGALEDTVIGAGTKIDNLVQVAHAVNIGAHCAIASQSGISGSAKVGNQVLMGGQAGVVPHAKIGDGAQVAAGAGIAKNVDPGEQVAGRPHRPLHQHMREWALIAWLVRPENRPRSKKDLES